MSEQTAPWENEEAAARGEDESAITLIDTTRWQSFTPEERREWALSRPRPHLREIARLAILGFKEKEIADALGRPTVHIRVCMKSPLFQQHLEELQKERDGKAVNVAERIAVLARIALDHQETRLLDSGTDEEAKDKIASQMLDRAGYTGKIIGEHVQRHVGDTYQQINIFTMSEEEKEKRLNELMVEHRVKALAHRGGKE